MTVYLRYQIILPHVSGLPKDSVINTFSFRSVDPATRTTAHADNLVALGAVYTALEGYYSTAVKLSEATYRAFDLTESQPRLPFDEGDFVLTDPADDDRNMPAEVALCVSFQGAASSGVNMRRRRGRVYLGPFQVPSTAENMLAPSAWPSFFANLFYDELVTGLGSASEWCVYSRLTHYGKPVGGTIVEGDDEVPEALPASFTPVTKVWCDNAWDTQRRRGVDATARTTLGS